MSAAAPSAIKDPFEKKRSDQEGANYNSRKERNLFLKFHSPENRLKWYQKARGGLRSVKGRVPHSSTPSDFHSPFREIHSTLSEIHSTLSEFQSPLSGRALNDE